MRSRSGFTLLEVLIAVAILGIAMVSIFSSSVGAVRAGFESTRMATSTLLARCTMGEIEERIAIEGLPAIEASGSDECCGGDSPEGYVCRWAVTRIVLPDELGLEDEEEDSGGSTLDEVAGTGDATELLAAGASGDIISELALNLAFPLLKPAIEDQVRRADVWIWWAPDTHGDPDVCDPDDPCLSVTQFLVAEPGSVAGGSSDDDI
jgi:general secretion pathway protein I